MNREPETRLIDASELRGRLTELMGDGPTTVYRRPPALPAPPAPHAAPPPDATEPVADASAGARVSRPARKPAPRPPSDEAGLVTQRSYTPVPAPLPCLPREPSSETSIVVRRPRSPVPMRLFVLCVGALLGGASLASPYLTGVWSDAPRASSPPPALPRPPRAGGAAAPPSERAARDELASPSAAPSPPEPALGGPPALGDPRAALRALTEGRRRDAILAYRALGDVPVYAAARSILEREERAEREGRSP